MKKWITAGIALIVLGAVVFGAGFIMAEGDIGLLDSQSDRVLNEYVFDGGFDTLRLETLQGDVTVEASTDGHIHILCYESETQGYRVEPQGGVLALTELDGRRWMEHIFVIDVKSYPLTVQVPEGLSLEIEGKYGDISIAAPKLSAVSVLAGHGEVELRDVEARSLAVCADYGAVRLENVRLREGAALLTTHGDVSFRDLDTPSLSVSCTYGSVRGALPGAINDYSIESSTRYGESNLPEAKPGGTRSLGVQTTHGDIEIAFEG